MVDLARQLVLGVVEKAQCFREKLATIVTEKELLSVLPVTVLAKSKIKAECVMYNLVISRANYCGKR